ncbi:MAG: GNAT family N-acetyltransferase [Halocynthiibacter sp.]
MSRSDESLFEVRLAENDAELRASQRLRYEIFVDELGGGGDLVDHDARLEKDRFDPYFDHLILLDKRLDPDGQDGLGQVIGVYRVLRGEKAAEIGQFYSENEYDLSKLKSSGRRLLELGRSCVHPDYRGGTAMFYLWNGLGDYVVDHGIEVLFGVASFHGTDVTALKLPLSHLYHNHLAPEELRVVAKGEDAAEMNLMPKEDITRSEAARALPSLIKAYLRLGGFVGDGAFIDHEFNTTDVCVLMDTEQLTEKQRSLYTKGRRA